MIEIKTIDHLNIKVANLNKSIDFYQKVFGFEVKERKVSQKSGQDYAIVGLSNKLLLVLCEDSADLSETRLNHFGINVVDFDAALSTIKSKKVTVVDYGGDDDKVITYDDSRSIYIQDPDGYEIELSSNFGGGL